MKLITPPSLQKGDTIAIVAPAGILKNRKHVIDKAKKLAQSWGLEVVYGKHLFNQAHHFAGTDEERCEDFQKALDNPNIKAIWAARGGYGSVRILDKLDFTKFKEKPKWVIGYSDITAFHNHIHNVGVETIHGIMGTSMQDAPEVIAKSVESLKRALFGESLAYEISNSKHNRLGRINGELVGGNIAILASMLGSTSQMSTDGKILFIEEIGEYKYSIDRMLQSLKRAGYFTKVKGIIVGDMTKVKKNTTLWGTSIEQLILDVIPNDVPVLFNFPAGHEPDNRALIMGRNITLNIKEKTATVNF
ncbi:LD-carboxypeptidase [Tenacibaculum sp. AHE15PA]|uniref:S66 peptidase family protein n=1 Tax=Tenacibaculum TaxID=104267 RepID=UPI001C4FCA45|nr:MULTISPECIES: LD-carboxypeptidase [Tenacibaculum]QXP73339.1 LD-carboxypeptidase [Tenacibaculum sp. AHE14PA]QXP77252.1 LD-carboxypeptidase [Tenacibaculum sp. AHE15PA]